MSSTEQANDSTNQELSASAREFLIYCNAERERRLNSGEALDQATFDAAVAMVIGKLRLLAEEGWT